MKILCVCDRGNVRSVTAARILKARGHDALSVGIKANSKDTLLMLYDWADIALVSEHWMAGFNKNSKVKDLEIGRDKWNEAMHPDLVKLIKRKLKEYSL